MRQSAGLVPSLRSRALQPSPRRTQLPHSAMSLVWFARCDWLCELSKLCWLCACQLERTGARRVAPGDPKARQSSQNLRADAHAYTHARTRAGPHVRISHCRAARAVHRAPHR